jgi:hypothetical protein
MGALVRWAAIPGGRLHDPLGIDRNRARIHNYQPADCLRIMRE